MIPASRSLEGRVRLTLALQLAAVVALSGLGSLGAYQVHSSSEAISFANESVRKRLAVSIALGEYYLAVDRAREASFPQADAAAARAGAEVRGRLDELSRHVEGEIAAEEEEEQELEQAEGQDVADMRQDFAALEAALAAGDDPGFELRRRPEALELEGRLRQSIAEEEEELAEAQEALAGMNRAMLALILIIPLLLLTLSGLVGLYLTRRILPRLSRLAAGAEAIGGGDLATRVEVSGQDELALLGRAFNEMAESLQRSRRDLARTSRMSGMAEIATGVLHNIGNVFNSVNVSVGLVEKRAAGLRSERLAQAAELIEARSGDLASFLADDPKGRLLPSYIAKAARSVEAERGSLLAEIARLRQNVEQAKRLISAQQAYARPVSSRQAERVDAIVEDALQMLLPSLEKHQIALAKDLADGSPLLAEPQSVLQILVNLIQNARDALAASAQPERRVTIRTRIEGRRARIEVEDNGVGVAPEDMARLFTFGHTTKRDGHGFGLHMSAIAARELRGALSCRSEGPGKGSTFALELPCAAADGAAEAPRLSA